MWIFIFAYGCDEGAKGVSIQLRCLGAPADPPPLPIALCMPLMYIELCLSIFNINNSETRILLKKKALKGTRSDYYQETIALVAKINSIRILLSVAVNFDWSVYQLDVKNVFFNGDLEEEVSMDL